MQRIMVIGCCGAGKSTISKSIHKILKLKLFHLDQLYWKPNWVETEKPEWETIVRAIAAEEEWIIDGNYSGTMDIRMQRANVVVFMDFPRWRCLYRVLKRIVVNYGHTRSDLAPDCPEHFDWEFIKYVYNFQEKKRPALLERLTKLDASTAVFTLNSNRDVKNFLKSLQKAVSKYE